jgi:hypothetical protein
MSLTNTQSTKSWNNIPKKCKGCHKAIYTIEYDDVYYQCSIFGSFKKDCALQIVSRNLPKPKEVLGE